jgi:hypothetical protein
MQDGVTPLHTAAALGNSDAVALLLDSGANRELKDVVRTDALWAHHCPRVAVSVSPCIRAPCYSAAH